MKKQWNAHKLLMLVNNSVFIVRRMKYKKNTNLSSMMNPSNTPKMPASMDSEYIR